MSASDRPSTSTDAPKPLLRRVHWILLGIAAFLVIVTVTVIRLIRVASADPPPPAPELADVTLSLPAPAPVSSVFANDVPGRLGVSEKRWHVLSNLRNEWRDDPAKDLAAIDTEGLAQLRGLFFTPGCPPIPTADLELGNGTSALGWMSHTSKVLAVRVVLWAELGRSSEAVDELVAVGERLLDVEQSCTVDLVGALRLAHAIDQVHGAARWVLAADAPDDVRLERLLRHLHALETRTSPLGNAFRQEHEVMRTRLAQVAAKEKRNWPYYDERDTLALMATYFKRLVWLAEAAPTDGVLGAVYPEQQWRDEIAAQPRYMTFFRYNALGRTLLIVSSEVGSAQYIGSWHQDRCMLAARRHAWNATLTERGRPPPTTVPAPVNPWTAKPFGSAGHEQTCPAPEAAGAPPLDGPLPTLPPARTPPEPPPVEPDAE